MNSTWLILDCNYLCHRARYAFGGLSHNGSATGVVYGFLKDIDSLKQKFGTSKVVFCWDFGKGLRKKIDLDYKANRKSEGKEPSPEEILELAEFKIQVSRLRKEYLKDIGYRNVFYQKGYEADDIIASVCKNLPEDDEAIIISADHDLYQLLSSKVSMYHPQKRKMVTKKSFQKEHEVSVKQWPMVKAIAGCSSDNIKGVMGVGEKTAIKYLRGELKKELKTFQDIADNEKNGTIKRNLLLVHLPLSGTKTFSLKEDNLSKSGWRKVTESLGLKSLKRKHEKDMDTLNAEMKMESAHGDWGDRQ
jgi:DNA polymerase-1